MCNQRYFLLNLQKKNGHEIDLVDLYKDKFNPVFAGEKANEEIKNYQSRIEKSDVIVFIYPIWWFRAPAAIEKDLLIEYLYLLGHFNLRK